MRSSLINTIPRLASSISLPPVPIIDACLDHVDLDEFRQKAFVPMKPVVMRAMNTEPATRSNNKMSIKVAAEWFQPISSTEYASSPSRGASKTLEPSTYLNNFNFAILPYELTIKSVKVRKHLEYLMQAEERYPHISELLCRSLKPYDPHKTFYRFHAPLTLFLFATSPACVLPLYIAQAQIGDLPGKLQEDIPTPRVVTKSGKGDIYDANIWMGTSTSYTPLHKDPNPNLFVQLMGAKKVRLFPPRVGEGLYQKVQQSIGASGMASMRGEEMMEEPERSLLEDRVWGEGVTEEGFEVEVGPEDALFIPKGWWHSIKSSGSGINVSVNWWFR
ncbi:hypothetical protein DSL72_004710 [Monilinia vaccinii-corymbosi]|uniref:JmjC domain-containing protein n=1 Tax=Monilinia vaccinii-corymbosi TaxID=61207 RepID=A0A8A3P181_9HELO|nr:hypothetical protein DSL72_004710 [Monilinia vaccinii-corymbosi]